MLLLRVTYFSAVFVATSVFCLDIHKKDDWSRKTSCRNCVETKNVTCIVETCENDNGDLIMSTGFGTAENSPEQYYNLAPPQLHCQDETILAFTWKYRANTTYFLEYSGSSFNMSERKYTNLVSSGYEIIRDIDADTDYEIQLTSISLINNEIVLCRSRPVVIKSLESSRTPLPVSRIYVDSFSLMNDTYNALIRWKPARDKSCYYDIVWFSQDDVGDYQQIEVDDPLSPNEVYISELNFGQNYSLEIRAISEGMDGRRESTETRIIVTVPSCLETYKSLEECVPESPTNVEVEEIIVDNNTGGQYPLYDVILSWAKPVFAPDFYTAYMFNYLKNSSDRINITGDTTNSTYRSIELGIYYEISLVAFSMKGPSSPVTLYRYLNGTLSPITGNSSAITTELTLILVSPVVLIGIVLILVFNRFLVRKVRMNYFKDVEEKNTPAENYIVTEGDLQEEPDEWEIHPDKLLITDVLGEGAFGVVRKGCFTSENESSVEVAIKMLRDNPTQEELKQFYQEIDIMKSVPSHPHLVSLIGCITRQKTKWPLLVVEFCSKGDLQTYLRSAWDKLTNPSGIKHIDLRRTLEITKCASNILYDLDMANNEIGIPQPKDLISFARQIALGMEYLSSLKLIHRDLAARNVLVCENNTIKISDFGLSRDVYHNNVYCKTTGGKLPIRWMALESITHQVYTTHSDVWSFGILLWEIVTLGSTPYPGVSTQNLLPLLKNGYRMEKPSNCSYELYTVMSKCWKASPKERPTFSELRHTLEDILERVSDYLNLNIFESTKSSAGKMNNVNKYKNVDLSGGYVKKLKGF